MKNFDDGVTEQLEKLERAGLRRRARKVEGPQGPWMWIDGRHVLCLSSNDYLGLARHPVLLAGVRGALDTEGLGAGASRQISGNMQSHRRVEEAFARYLRCDASALFATGYACNVGTVQALVGRDDVVFSDALNHASLIDGTRLSRARTVIFKHADAEDLRRKLIEHRGLGSTALIVTESLFSMDGDVAPLVEFSQLAKQFNAGLMVDEAHALGICGPRGSGLCAELGVHADVTVATLGKAFGSQGALVAGAESTVELIRNRARSYVFSTAPWPALAGAALAALQLIMEADGLRARLRANTRTLRNGLSALGYRVLDGDSPIIPVMVGEPQPTMQLSQRLFERGVFVHGVRPPTVPDGTGRLRVVPMATHTEADIQEALVAFAEVRA